MPGPDGMLLHHNLPSRPVLVGRAAELAQTSELLFANSTRLLTLIGPGGTGKTALGLVLAEAALPHFADGVWFVDLSALPAGEANLLWPAVAQALHIAEASVNVALDVLHQVLADKELVLLLDNVEHVLEAALPLGRLLDACPRVRVLATSREPLHLRREYTFEVGPLALPDLAASASPEALATVPAVSLFVERAKTVSPSFALDSSSARAVAEVCVRLGGLPLAIELAAARSRVLAPQALLDRLRKQTTRLSTANRDVPQRHRTLWATIAWSYDLLDQPSQTLFRYLGLFGGSFDAEAAAAVCAPVLDSTNPIDVLDSLLVLVDKSLLRTEHQPAGAVRFRMLDTLREFALDLLHATGEAHAAAARHATFYLDLAERAGREFPGTDEVLWLDRLEVEYPNLRRAVRWVCAAGMTDRAVQACVALSLFWRLRGHSSEVLAWLEHVLPDTEGMPLVLRAHALELAGRLGWASGRRDAAQAWLSQSIALWRTVGDRLGLARALIELGMQAADRGRSEAARAALEEGLGLARSLGDVVGTAQALHGLGFRAEERGELELAAALLEESVVLRQSVGHPSGLARSLNGLGIVARAQGDLERAQALHLQSLALYRDLGHDLGAAYALAYLGRAVARAGDHAQAVRLGCESLHLAWEHRNPWAMAEAVDLLGLLAARYGLVDQAARLLAAVERLLGGTRPTSSVARAEHDAALALTEQALGQRFTASWAAGHTLSMPGVVEQALRVVAALEPLAASDADTDSPPPSGPLSARELEVARLVGLGLTNREIAERLVISRWTVDNHVASILRKLEFGRRAQVATWLAAGQSVSR